jgi:hypothetical protein
MKDGSCRGRSLSVSLAVCCLGISIVTDMQIELLLAEFVALVPVSASSVALVTYAKAQKIASQSLTTKLP